MKKVNVIRVLLVVLIVALLSCVSNISKAQNLNDLIPGANTNKIENIQQLEGANIPGRNTNTNNNAAPTNLLPVGGNTNKNTNTNSALPKTGVDDTIMWVLIAVSTVAAIYTYKKVRDYDIK